MHQSTNSITFTERNKSIMLPKHGYLTQSLNKRQKIRTMARELSMVQVAYVGLYQAQLTHLPCWGHWGPCWGSGGVQSQKIGHF